MRSECNRSRPGEQRRGRLMVEMGLHRPGDEVKDALRLLPTGFDDGEDRLHKATSPFALGAERQFSPNDRMTQAALAGVVGRLNAVDLQERPKPFSMIVQFLTHALQPRVGAKDPAQQ